VRVLDSFASVDHLVGALLLSSYIPGATGRLRPHPVNSAVGRARQALGDHWGLKTMDRHGPAGSSGTEPAGKATAAGGQLTAVLAPPAGTPARQAAASGLFDGGLGLNWPVLDRGTVLVSPLAVRPIGRANVGRPVICPKGSGRVVVPMAPGSSTASAAAAAEASAPLPPSYAFDREVALGSQGVGVDANMDTLRLANRMLLSSEPGDLDKSFASGFDDATRFLRDGGRL
jgi:hypothetical protein